MLTADNSNIHQKSIPRPWTNYPPSNFMFIISKIWIMSSKQDNSMLRAKSLIIHSSTKHMKGNICNGIPSTYHFNHFHLVFYHFNFLFIALFNFTIYVAFVLR